jgi:hypothetical protein
VALYVSAPGKTLRVSADACNFVASIDNAAFKLDSGVVTQRAPTFALGSVTTTPTLFTSLGSAVLVSAKFYTLGGASAPNVQVFFTGSFKGRVRNVLGLFGGPMTTDANGILNYTVDLQKGSVGKYIGPLPGVSQPFGFAFVAADPRYSWGAREQLFGNPNGLGDFWSSATFNVLLAARSFAFSRAYLYVPTTVGFATASVANTLVPVNGLIQVTVTVTNGTGGPIANATVWSASIAALTDATGKATFTVPAGVGSTENLAVVTTPDGQVIRAWYGAMASDPVLTYGAITAAVQPAGSASTFSLQVNNTLAVAGTVTVLMKVGNTVVAAQQVAVGSAATAQVRFSYVFAAPGTYTVQIGSQTSSVTVPSQDVTASYVLGGGLLVAGLAVGAVVGLLLARRRKPPTTTAETPMERSPEESKEPEDELGP